MKLQNFLRALIVGVIGGTIIYFITRNDIEAMQMLSMFLVGFIGVAAYFMASYKKAANIKLLLAILAGYFAFTAISFFIVGTEQRGENYKEILIFSFFITSVITTGAITVALSEKSLARFHKGFTNFVYKIGEIALISILIGLATAALIGLGYELLRISGIEIPDEVMEWMAKTAVYTVPLVGLSLSYDFTKSISGQPPAFKLLSLISKLATALIFPISAFLFIYILLLVPSAFGKVLETGSTVGIFTSIIMISMLVFYFSLPTIEQWKKHEGFMILWKIAVGMLFLETLILNAVSVHAIRERIEQYGYTFGRYLVILMLIAVFIALAAFAFTTLKNFLQKRKVEDLIEDNDKINVIIIATFLILFVIAPLVIDLEQLSVKNQFQKVSATEDFAERHIDRYYFSRTGQKTVEFLKNEYAQANTRTKLDIILTLDYIAKDAYYVKEIMGEKSAETLERIAETETDEQISGFLELLSDPNYKPYKRCEEALKQTFPQQESYYTFCQRYSRYGDR